MSKTKNPTIRDIARIAGVSTATVSRAFAKPGQVAEPTRQRVLDLAERLGYRLNMRAVDFRHGRTNAIIVLVSDIANPFYSEFFKGIEERARSDGYILLIGDTAGDAKSEETYIGMLLTGRADGLIINTGFCPESLAEPFARSPSTMLPPVVSCADLDGLDVPTVQIDNYRSSQLAAEHLLGLGHHRMAVICGPLSIRGFADRLAGFADLTQRAGRPIPDDLIVTGGMTMESARALTTSLMTREDRPTAIFAHSDEMAMGALHALRNLGLRVPEDVSVVGYDDMNYAKVVTPSLTTVHLPRRLWGATACQQLLLQISSGDHALPNIDMPTELIVRQTTAPPPR
ncbi:MAG: LacI family DNA-binding transcriptional regulator [Pseudomonadota bacterium]